MTKEEMCKWMDEKGILKKYEIIDWANKMTSPSLFLDKDRNIKFSCSATIFKRNIKRNINSVFGASKEEKKELIKNSNLKKYGVSHPGKLNKLKERVKQTNIKKYGAENIMQTQEGKEKLRNSMNEKYGVSHYSHSEEFKDKIKKAWFEKSKEEKDEIVLKRKEKIEDVYGSVGLGHEKILEKKIKTNMKRYGVSNPRKHKSVADKIKETSLEKYGFESPLQSPEIKEKILASKIEKGYYKFYKGKNLKEWAEEVGFSRTHFNNIVNNVGFESAVQIKPSGGTAIESLVGRFLEENEITFIQNRQLAETKFRPDFLIEDKSLIIECNGLWYHSDKHPDFKSRAYHKDKKEEYKLKGYNSLFFNEDELLKNLEIVKSIILNKLGRSKRVFARKCEIKTVNKDQASGFFKENHLMGNGSGRTYGMFFNDTLICAAQVRWKNKEDKILEISRFCPKINNSIVGGFSKLISFIKKNEKPNMIMTFIDRRYGSGDYLTNLGWELSSNHLSFQWVDLNKCETFHRMNFPGNSGYENGMAKIWDCGQAKFVFDCNK